MFANKPSQNFSNRLALRIVALAGLLCVCSSPVRAQTNPANYSGVLTRWQTSTTNSCGEAQIQGAQNSVYTTPCATQDAFYTPTPSLFGLDIADWYNNLLAKGVNMGVIYVVLPNDGRLAASATISNGDWNQYVSDIYLAPAALTNTQMSDILTIQPQFSYPASIPRPLVYTQAQRNDAIVDFLVALQAQFKQYNAGNPPPIQFILDEREWYIQTPLDPNNTPIPMAVGNILNQDITYASDISTIVAAAEQAGVDYWLGGMRLSEYASKDWNTMGPVMLDLAYRVNQQTASLPNYPNGWLTYKTFIGAGAGWGQQWKGVNAMQCPTPTGGTPDWSFSCSNSLPFFNLMQGNVHYFAFGDKFMEYSAGNFVENNQYTNIPYQDINGEAFVYCQQNPSNCSNPLNPTQTDWTNFLSDDVNGLGFSDLVSFMQANASTYPNLANVIFEGDSSDSFNTMTRSATTLGAENSIGAQALAALFANEVQQNIGTWTGKLFLDGYNDTSASTSCYTNDTGQSLYTTPYDEFTFSPTNASATLMPDTESAWATWPNTTTLGTLQTNANNFETATPILSHGSGRYGVNAKITITDQTTNSNIYYTTDGSNPGVNSTQYVVNTNKPTEIPIAASETFKAIAMTGAGCFPSSVASAVYTIPNTQIDLGDTTEESKAGSSHINTLQAFKEALGQTATVNSLSLYLSAAAREMYLGIYSDAGGYPDKLLATTPAFTPIVGWNPVNVTSSQVSLLPGNYWIAFNSSGAGDRILSTGSPTNVIEESVASNFGALPTTFPATGTVSNNVISFYATTTTP